MKKIKALLGSESEYDFAMGMVHIDDPPGPVAITGNARGFGCGLEAIVSVNVDKRLAVAVTGADGATAISVFSEQRATTLEQAPRIKSWVEEFQKRCGSWEVKFTCEAEHSYSQMTPFGRSGDYPLGWGAGE